MKKILRSSAATSPQIRHPGSLVEDDRVEQVEALKTTKLEPEINSHILSELFRRLAQLLRTGDKARVTTRAR